MPRALVIQHVGAEGLNLFGPTLRGKGFEIRTVSAWTNDLRDARLDSVDLLVVLGGPISANDEAQFSFLRREMELIGDAIETGVMILGICLGAQLIAKVLGAKVYANRPPEIGYAPLILSAEGRQSCLSEWGESLPVLHWHGETFDLPMGSTQLASTQHCSNQAFSYGSRVLGLQFHPEVSAPALEGWLVAHAYELASRGVSLDTLRTQARDQAELRASLAEKLLLSWLNEAGQP